jgi:hypothetical protein
MEGLPDWSPNYNGITDYQVRYTPYLIIVHDPSQRVCQIGRYVFLYKSSGFPASLQVAGNRFRVFPRQGRLGNWYTEIGRRVADLIVELVATVAV